MHEGPAQTPGARSRPHASVSPRMVLVAAELISAGRLRKPLLQLGLRSWPSQVFGLF